MKAKNLDEQINRILTVSEYKIPESKRILVEMMTPLTEIQPLPTTQPIQQNTAQSDEAFEHEIDIALNQLIQALPQELQQIATTQGNKDGQIEPIGQQSVAEIELNEAILSVLAGGALALPAIGNLVGKAVSYLGKKIDNQTTQIIGQKVSHAAEHLHHKYEGLIDKILSPLTKYVNPQIRKNINTTVFYALVAALGGAGAIGATKAAVGGNVGLAAIESGLSSIKAAELITLARNIVPKILANVV